ncbi:GNAT family N-acetyltransferase [Natrialbaceae archaeon A-gly3]
MAFETRAATSEDEESLLELWHGFTDHLSEYDPRYRHKEHADEHWLSYFRSQLLDSKYGIVFVAEDEETGELIGVLEARVMGDHPIFNLSDHGLINGHFVREDFREEGVGKELVNAAHEWFASPPRDVDFYRVNVIEGDELAPVVYEDLGFDAVEHVYEKRVE